MPAPRILQPGEIESFSSAIPYLLLPEDRLFRTRAERLRRLAPEHTLGDYLSFIAAVAEQQHILFDALVDIAEPDGELVRHCQQHGIPPLSTKGWTRDPVWLELARTLAQDLAPTAPEQAKGVMAELLSRPNDWLERQADALLALNLDAVDLAASTIVGAALQVYWSRLASTLDPTRIGRSADSALCPVCGSHPMVSLVHIGGTADSLRYLVCSLCASQWYLERVKCSNCDNTRDLGYAAVENPTSAIRAESCPECKSYLKILYQNQTPDLEPTADDLASIALDWLMSEEGYARSGVNLMLLQG